MKRLFDTVKTAVVAPVSNSRRADVSVVIPAYNAAATLERALESVAAQTLLPEEVLIVDDASADATAAIASSLASRFPQLCARVIRLAQNKGPATARNTGWNESKSAFIAFLDADDAWHPRKLEIQYTWMVTHPGVGLSGHACPESLPGNMPIIDDVRLQVRQLSAGRLLLSNQFSTPTAMLRRTLPYRFKADKRFTEDYLLWLQMVLDGIPAAYMSLSLAFIYKPAFGATGLSSQLWKMETGELATYRQLARERRLSLALAGLLMVFSFTKFLRRQLLCSFRPVLGE